MRGGVSTLQQSILAKAADGSGEEKKLLDIGAYQGLQSGLCDWSPDGRYILYIAGTASVGNGTDIWALPLFGDRKPSHTLLRQEISYTRSFLPMDVGWRIRRMSRGRWRFM